MASAVYQFVQQTFGWVGDLAVQYGPRLLYGSIVYTLMGMMVYLWMVSSGVEAPVALVPPGLGDLAARTFEVWGTIYTVFSDGKLDFAEAIQLAAAAGSAMLLFFALLAQSTINYFWIAVQLTELIPPPYQFITVITWLALGLAQVLLLTYIVQRILPAIQQMVTSILPI